MKDEHYTIKTMNKKEIDIAIEWAAKEGWNPGFHDADCYHQADPNGFLIGMLNGEPIATICVIKYGQSFGFLGYYIVKPEYRGQGYGIQIWNAGLKYLEGRNIGLDGVIEMQDDYNKSGFNTAYRNIRYQGVGGGAAPDNPNIVALASLPFDTIERYSQPFFPEQRSAFLNAWIEQPEAHSLGIMQNGSLAGYGVLRQCRNGYKLGPLFADSPELAESLFVALKSNIAASEPLFIDVPEVNPAAVALAERYKMQISFETARMYTGDFPNTPMDRLFGVTSFEIG